MLLHSYFAIDLAPLCGGVLASMVKYKFETLIRYFNCCFTVTICWDLEKQLKNNNSNIIIK